MVDDSWLAIRLEENGKRLKDVQQSIFQMNATKVQASVNTSRSYTISPQENDQVAIYLQLTSSIGAWKI